MDSANRGRELTTLTKSLQILDYVKQQNNVMLSDITDEFDMAKSTAHGYMSTLEKLGLLTKTNGKYALGLHLVHLGQHAKDRYKLLPIAKSAVEELGDDLNESTDFMMPERGRLLTLYHNEMSPKDPNFRIGRYFYMHNSAGGKAVMAELSDQQIEEIIDRWGLPATTDKTIVSEQALFEEIERVREQGFATTDEELTEGLRSVGTTIKYPGGEIFGALGVGGPKYRLDEERLFEQVPRIMLEKIKEVEIKIECEL